MDIVIAGASDCGTVRKANEDFFYYSQKNRFVVVCDGMGGHQGGAVASRIAGETMRDVFTYADLAELRYFCSDIQERLPEIALRLLAGARLANRRLHLMAEQDLNMRGMGTTLVAMAFNDTTACAVHVGDSRAYQFEPKALQLLTEDHSWVNELLQDREIRAEEVQHFSKKNVLTRALGTHLATKIDVQWFPLQSGAKFLLCTDGLHNALQPEAISQNFQGKDETALVQTLERLVQRAKQANGADNITAAAVFIKNIQPTAVRSKHMKMTIAEEPGPLLAAEDRFVKRQFFGAVEKKAPPSPARRRAGRTFPMAAAIALLALAGYYFNPFDRDEESAATDTLSANARFETPATTAPVQPEPGERRAAGDETRSLWDSSAAPAIDSARLAPIAFDSIATIVGRQAPVRGLSPAPVHEEDLATTASAISEEEPTPPNVAQRDSVSTPAHDPANPLPVEVSENDDPAPESLVPQTGGRIFLPGLAAGRYGSAEIFANETTVGPVSPLAETGFFLPPGVYTIAIKDSSGRVLHQKANVIVSQGDVKTLEF